MSGRAATNIEILRQLVVVSERVVSQFFFGPGNSPKKVHLTQSAHTMLIPKGPGYEMYVQVPKLTAGTQRVLTTPGSE